MSLFTLLELSEYLYIMTTNSIQTGSFTWNIDELAQSMRLTSDEVQAYFTDGRRVSFLLERRIAREVIHGSLAKSEGAAYDVLDPQGQKWEVRSITRGGIYFCPSYMVGSGRSFHEEGFLEKLDEIEGYIVSDIESFPRIPYWMIPVNVVRLWWDRGELGAATKINRKKALELVKRIG
jgi:hypothetical protein